MPSLIVNHFALVVHHIIVFQQSFSNTKVVFLYLFLRTLYGFGNHGMLDDFAFFNTHAIHQPGNAVRTEQAHEVVFQ